MPQVMKCGCRIRPTWKEGQAGPRRRPQPFSRILTAWKGNSQKSTYRIVHILNPR